MSRSRRGRGEDKWRGGGHRFLEELADRLVDELSRGPGRRRALGETIAHLFGEWMKGGAYLLVGVGLLLAGRFEFVGTWIGFGDLGTGSLLAILVVFGFALPLKVRSTDLASTTWYLGSRWLARSLLFVASVVTFGALLAHLATLEPSEPIHVALAAFPPAVVVAVAVAFLLVDDTGIWGVAAFVAVTVPLYLIAGLVGSLFGASPEVVGLAVVAFAAFLAGGILLDYRLVDTSGALIATLGTGIGLVAVGTPGGVVVAGVLGAAIGSGLAPGGVPLTDRTTTPFRALVEGSDDRIPGFERLPSELIGAGSPREYRRAEFALQYPLRAGIPSVLGVVAATAVALVGVSGLGSGSELEAAELGVAFRMEPSLAVGLLALAGPVLLGYLTRITSAAIHGYWAPPGLAGVPGLWPNGVKTGLLAVPIAIVGAAGITPAASAVVAYTNPIPIWLIAVALPLAYASPAAILSYATTGSLRRGLRSGTVGERLRDQSYLVGVSLSVLLVIPIAALLIAASIDPTLAIASSSVVAGLLLVLASLWGWIGYGTAHGRMTPEPATEADRPAITETGEDGTTRTGAIGDGEIGKAVDEATDEAEHDIADASVKDVSETAQGAETSDEPERVAGSETAETGSGTGTDEPEAEPARETDEPIVDGPTLRQIASGAPVDLPGYGRPGDELAGAADPTATNAAAFPLAYLRRFEFQSITSTIGFVIVSPLVLPALLLTGYLLRVASSIAAGYESPPAFDDYPGLLRDGGIFWLGYLPMGLLAGASGVLGASAVGAVGYPGYALAVPAAVVVYLTPAAMLAYSRTGRIRGMYVAAVQRYEPLSRSYLGAWLYQCVLTALFVVVPVGVVPITVGLPILPFAIAAWLLLSTALWGRVGYRRTSPP